MSDSSTANSHFPSSTLFREQHFEVRNVERSDSVLLLVSFVLIDSLVRNGDNLIFCAFVHMDCDSVVKLVNEHQFTFHRLVNFMFKSFSTFPPYRKETGFFYL